MEQDLYLESTLNDSFIYSMFNRNNEMQHKIVKALVDGSVIDYSYVEEQIIQINKSRISPLAQVVVDSFVNGDIVLKYVSTVKMTSAIPFILHKDQGKTKATIFISSFGKLSKDGKSIDIPMKSLYVLLESAYIALYLNKYNGRLQRNSLILNVLNKVYTEMIIRILNKEYALSLDRELYDKVSFSISAFFLKNVAELENSTAILSYASSTVKNLDFDTLKIIYEEFNERNITTINQLIEYIGTFSTRLSGITVRYMVERYLNTYGQSSILALDYLPYLFFILSNTMLSGFLVSRPSLADIVKNTPQATKFYAELTKLVV